MSAPVDVLAVLDALGELPKVRAAVAELIEADEEYDRLAVVTDMPARQFNREWKAVQARRRAALVRVKGRAA